MDLLGSYQEEELDITEEELDHSQKMTQKKPVHLTAFAGFKAGMTHILR